MSVTLADKLLQNYIRKVDSTCSKFDLIDLFTNSEAKGAIQHASDEEIYLNVT